MTQAEKAREKYREWLELDKSGGTYYQRVVQGQRLAAKYLTYENAENYGLTTTERSKVYSANLWMIKNGWDASDLYDPINNLTYSEMDDLYTNYRNHGLTRAQIFEIIPGMEYSVTNYQSHWDARHN